MPIGGIARAQKTIIMAFSDRGGSAEIPTERAAGQVSKPDSVPASLEDRIGLRRFSLRGLGNATSEFLFAGIAHNLRLLATAS